jgi:hypothetical protein
MARDLASFLRRRERRPEEDPTRCSGCDRVPLAGELMHELETRSTVCELCLADLPDGERTPVASVRVRASEAVLAVVSRAA